MTDASSGTLLIGCGNPLRGDDAAGPEVARRLRGRTSRPDVECRDGGTAGIDVAFQMRGRDHVILVDACRSDGETGAIYELRGEDLEQLPPPQVVTLHAVRWDQAVACGRRLLGDAYPRQVTVFLIEGGSFEPGGPLSPAVERAVDALVGLLARRLTGADPACDGTLLAAP